MRASRRLLVRPWCAMLADEFGQPVPTGLERVFVKKTLTFMKGKPA